jgi:hypothetical protein
MRSAALLPALFGAATAADAALLFSAALILALVAVLLLAALAALEDLLPLAAGFFAAAVRLPAALAAVPDEVRFVRLRVFARGSLTFQHRGDR